MITAVYRITDFAPHYHHVHILINGEYTGIGLFASDREEMIAFCRAHNVTKIERR